MTIRWNFEDPVDGEIKTTSEEEYSHLMQLIKLQKSFDEYNSQNQFEEFTSCDENIMKHQVFILQPLCMY